MEEGQCDGSDPAALIEADNPTENEGSYVHRERHRHCLVTPVFKSVSCYHGQSLILTVTKMNNTWHASVRYKI